MLKHHDAKFFESLNVLFIDLTFYFFQILMMEEKKLRSSSYLTLTQNLLTFSSFFPVFFQFFSNFFPLFFSCFFEFSPPNTYLVYQTDQIQMIKSTLSFIQFYLTLTHEH